MTVWRCPDCPAAFGAWLSGCPRCRSTKELVMALNVCAGCTARFAVGLPRCPQCRSTDFQEDGVMPKITLHAGATVAGASVTGGQWGDGSEPDEPKPAAAEEAVGEDEGGEEPSASNSSETSSETPSSTPEPNEKPSPKRARTTGSRSRKAPTENSSASGTAGAPEDGTSAADGAESESADDHQ